MYLIGISLDFTANLLRQIAGTLFSIRKETHSVIQGLHIQTDVAEYKTSHFTRPVLEPMLLRLSPNPSSLFSLPSQGFSNVAAIFTVVFSSCSTFFPTKVASACNFVSRLFSLDIAAKRPPGLPDLPGRAFTTCGV